MASRVLALVMLAGLLFFAVLGNHQLQNSTEPRVAGIAMQMYLSGDWVTPKIDNQPFLEKPPLSLWLDASAIRFLGASPGAVRLASACAGLLSVLLLYVMLRRLGRPLNTAWSAAFVLATTASFWINSRQVGEDALLALGVTTALLAFFYAHRNSRTQGLRIGPWLLFSLGIAISTLSKGVLGLALPGVVIFAYLVADSLLEKHLRLTDWIRPALFTLLALLALFVWLCFLYRAGGMQPLKDLLWTNSVGRFSGSFREAGHYAPFYYYLARLPQAFWPWGPLAYLGLWHFRKQLFESRFLLFFSLWLVAPFLLLTLSSSKRMVYLMSLAPAAAVLAAEYLSVLHERLRLQAERSSFARRLIRHERSLVRGAIVLIVSSYLLAALWWVPREDRQFSFVPLVERLQALQTQGHHVALFQPSERLAGASVFYTQSLIDTVMTDADLNAFLAASPDNVAVMELGSEPVFPLKVVSQVTVGNRVYYMVSR